MELIELVKAFLQNNSPEKVIYNPAVTAEFDNLYRKVFKQKPSCLGCGNKVYEDYNLLTRFANGEAVKPNNDMNQFKLKKGAEGSDMIVYDPISNADYSERSSGWCDTIALNVLSVNPSEIKKFDEFPDNWQELAAAQKEVNDASRELREAADKKIIAMEEQDAARLKAEAESAIGVNGLTDTNVAINSDDVTDEPDAKNLINTPVERQSQHGKGKHGKGR